MQGDGVSNLRKIEGADLQEQRTSVPVAGETTGSCFGVLNFALTFNGNIGGTFAAAISISAGLASNTNIATTSVGIADSMVTTTNGKSVTLLFPIELHCRSPRNFD